MASIDELIAQARELSKEATSGDWSYETCYGVATVTAQGHDDVAHAVEYLNFRNAEFIVFARNNLLALVEEIERLQADRAKASEQITGLIAGSQLHQDAVTKAAGIILTHECTIANLRSENESLKNGIAPTLEMLNQALAERLDFMRIAVELRAENEALWKVAYAVCRLGLDINPPTGPEHHADMYSFDNGSVRLVAASLAALPPRKETT